MRGARHLALASLLGLVACEGASPQSGLASYLRATNAQYAPGELGDGPAADLPKVDLIKSNNTRVFPGAQGRVVSGSVSGTATAVLIGLEGDRSHWLVPVGAPDLEMPGNFTFGTTLSFSPDLPLGTRALRFRAISADGQLGPAQALALKVESATAPPGALVIRVDWDAEADLDLHVRIPNAADEKMPYFDVWAKAPRALPNQSPDYTPAELEAGGRLLFDSNAQCVIDGQRHEELVFPMGVPAGPYEVRVDAFSLCGEATARWHATAFRNTDPVEVLAEAYGQSGDRDTVGMHTGGSGTLAFTFTP
jgi:hypothetical protein